MKIYFILLSITTVYYAFALHIVTNFNQEKIRPTYDDHYVTFPFLINNPLELRYTEVNLSTINISKYKPKQPTHMPDLSKLSDSERKILSYDIPPDDLVNGFDIFIPSHQVLSFNDFQLIIANPTTQFKFCLTNIFIDSKVVKNFEFIKFPYCIDPETKYPLTFRTYSTDYNPKAQARLTVFIHIMLDLYMEGNFMASKIWTHKVEIYFQQNYLRLKPLEAMNCGKNVTKLTISNYEAHPIELNFSSKTQLQSDSPMKKVIIEPHKTIKMGIIPQQTVLRITTPTLKPSGAQYPTLFMPISCQKFLKILPYNIGVIESDRSIIQIPLMVSCSYTNNYIQIVKIECFSSAQTAQIKPITNANYKVKPEKIQTLIGKIILHLNKVPSQKSSIKVRVTYFVSDNPNQLETTEHEFVYFELNRGISFKNNRMINVHQERLQKKQKGQTKIINHIYIMKNHMNIPLRLLNVIHDRKYFRVMLANDRQKFIYPNQQKGLFLLKYVGPLNLPISPVKQIITLQFNGKIHIPVEIVIYDGSLQCIVSDIKRKCSQLSPIDFGYLRNTHPKSKKLIIRNWNPIASLLQIDLIKDSLQNFGLNFTMNISGPYPQYDMLTKRTNTTISYSLKGHHFIVIEFTMTPLDNATSGITHLKMKTTLEQITITIKFKVQNATITIIPQVVRIDSLFEESTDYLNIVSNYSEPQKIKSAVTNVSSLQLIYQNNTKMTQNQWFPITLIYKPFRNNITELCCHLQFAIDNFIPSLYLPERTRYTYALVQVQTTTDLSVNSTVVLDNMSPQLMKNKNLTIKVLNVQNMLSSKITIQNIFGQPLKFSVILIPNQLYRESRQYLLALRRARKHRQQIIFCVNENISLRHNFSPQMVKKLLNLSSVPQQITIQPLQNSEYYISSQGQNYYTKSKQLSKYIVDTVNQGARICYRFHSSKYVKYLVQTKVLNDLAQHHSHLILQNFIRKQMECLNKPSYFLEYDAFYEVLSIDLRHYCQLASFQLFRFCKHINLMITPKQEKVIMPNEQYDIELKIGNYKTQQSSYSFYLSILNNITRYESHYIEIVIQQPKISLQTLYISDQKAIIRPNFNDSYFNDWMQVFDQYYNQESNGQLIKFRVNTLPILISDQELVGEQYAVQRIFSIKNQGSMALEFSHVGIGDIEYSCNHRNIEIMGMCKEQSGFTLRQNQSKNISIRIRYPLEQQSCVSKITNLYFYYHNYYYFRIQLTFKLPQNVQIPTRNTSLLCSRILNIISLFFLISVFWKKQRQAQKTSSQVMLNKKMLPFKFYDQLGTKMLKKRRSLDLLVEDLVLALQVQNNENCSLPQINHNIPEQGSESGSTSILQEFSSHPNSGAFQEEQSVEIREKSQQFNQRDLEGDEQDSLFGQDLQLPNRHDQSNFGWNNESNENKRREQNQSNQYYNIFLSQNPLKKDTKDPFHWMQDYQSNQQW